MRFVGVTKYTSEGTFQAREFRDVRAGGFKLLGLVGRLACYWKGFQVQYCGLSCLGGLVLGS